MRDIDFFEMLNAQYSINLTEQQKKAVTNIEGPSLVLACPGSGKTTMLLSRTAYLITNGIKPENILSITFSKMSANDMDQRFEKIFGSFIKNTVKFSTIHSLAYSIVREYNRKDSIKSILIEENGNGSYKPPTTKTKLLKQIYKDINKGVMTEEESESLINSVSFVKNMMLKTNEFGDYEWDVKNFREIYEEYEKRKKLHSYIDFDDMLSECLKILNKDGEVLGMYQYRFKYIQVDEAQDTSKVQHEIIKVLGGKNNNIFYVADDDQSIYGFRGAFPEFLINIKEIYNNVKVFYMEENFRSSKDIVSVCNRYIKKNTVRFDKNIFTNNPSHMPIQILSVNEKEDQLIDIVAKLKNKQGDTSVAVLYRNNISAVLMANELIKAGISFKIKGFKKHFFEHWMISDIFAIINVALNNKDVESFEKIYYKLNGYYISKLMINAIKNDNRDISIFEKLLSIPKLEDYEKNNIRKLAGDLRLLSTRKVDEMLDFIEYYLGYKQITSSNAIILKTLKSLSRGLSTPEELMNKLNKLKTDMENSLLNKDKNPVILSTSHSSKGLEWDEVYIIDVVDGTFPSYSYIYSFEDGDIAGMEEDRRLFYVSMTRARSKLTLYNVIDSYGRFVNEVEIVMGSLDKKEMRGKKETKNIEVENQEENIVNFDVVKIIEIVNTFKNEDVLVKHKKFGIGLIKNINDEHIEIEFEGDITKVFSLEFCCKNNLLLLIS